MGARQSNERQDRRQPKRATNYSSDITWVSEKLTPEQKAEFTDWVATKQTALESELATLIEDGYRLTVSWDSYAGLFQVSMFTRDLSNVNCGKMLVSRASDWYRAVLMSVFKHTFLHHGEWSTSEQDTRGEEG